MTILTSEDSSRAVWPSCPAQGWRSGVNRLSSHPDGVKLNPAPASRASAEVDAFGAIETTRTVPARRWLARSQR